MTERTIQQLDAPVSLAMRPVTLAAAVVAAGYAGLNTIVEREEIDHPVLALAALALIALASTILWLASSPLRAPFRRRHSSLAVLAGVGAAVTSAASMIESNTFVRDDWGQVSVGILFLGLVPYRPAREIAGFGALAAVALGFLALLQAPSLGTAAPPQVFSFVAMLPVLAMSFGSATLAAGIRTAVERWHRLAERASRRFGEEVHDGIARSVQQEHVTVLNRDVVPFLLNVVERGRVDEGSRARAAELSTALREVVVAGVDRVWLQTVLLEIGEAESALDGDAGALEQLTSDERIAVRAFLARLVRHRGFVAGSVRVRVDRDTERVSVELAADVASGDVSHRNAFGPYLGVLRVAFPDLTITSEGDGLRLKFSYGNR